MHALEYTNDAFAARARKMIANHQVFSFDITGRELAQLQPHLVNGAIPEPSQLGLEPGLRPLLLVLLLADAQAQAVSLEVHPDRIRVWVGVGSA